MGIWNRFIQLQEILGIKMETITPRPTIVWEEP